MAHNPPFSGETKSMNFEYDSGKFSAKEQPNLPNSKLGQSMVIG
jgi:hypothetical protein